ncbi:MAG TPA: hypothetical protein VHY79_06990 [Rhizomicrobium sp.]|jgi:hypothetical protein|nr:hypothetical protein [Rhizomicrobium sp.]
MRCQLILLGGAMALALSGAAFAQGSGSAQNSQPVAQSQQSSDTSATDKSGSQTSKHMTHHMRHHMRRHVLRTASAHMRVTPAERAETNNLNREQLRAVQYAPGPQYGQGSARYPQEPGRATGLTPARRLPNGVPFQSATPAGGRSDTQSVNQAHRL